MCYLFKFQTNFFSDSSFMFDSLSEIREIKKKEHALFYNFLEG